MTQDYLLAYGSLLNKYSRETYSGIVAPIVRAQLNGWSRAWCAVYEDESATYAGATPNIGQKLDVLIIPTQITPELQQRERGYRFNQVEGSEIEPHAQSGSCSVPARFYICETLSPLAPSTTNPLPQSYVDTCLLGCFEVGGEEAMRRFVTQTLGWHSVWVNDRDWQTPIYPRGATLSAAQRQLVDGVLRDLNVLQWRTSA